jgi:hypothetical protein
MDNNVVTTEKGIDMDTNTYTEKINTDNIGGNINGGNINGGNINGGNININSTDNDIQKARTLFDSCKYNEAEQIFAKIKGSEAAAWRILCCIVTNKIGKKGGMVVTLLQDSIKNKDASIDETVTLLKMLINEYGSAIDRKIRNRVIIILQDTFDDIIKDKMSRTISDVNKRALEIVQQKGYTPSIYDDKTIPLKVLNSKLNRYKCRIRHYKPEDIVCALKIINSDQFVQEVVDEYTTMAHSIAKIEKNFLDTRNLDVLKYIRGLYISNIAYEKELRLTGNIDKLQFIKMLNRFNEKGWVLITMSDAQNTRRFNMANDEEKAMCEIEIERSSTASAIVSLMYDDIIEKRGYLINDGVVNQISKEDIAIGDITNKYTRQYVGPVLGTIYYDYD